MDKNTKYCPECGQQLMVDVNFCDRCGTEQSPPGSELDASTDASSETAQHQQPDRRQPTPTPSGADTDSKVGAALKWIGVFFVVIILSMAVSAFVLGLGDAGDGPEATVESYWGALDDGDIDAAADHAAGEHLDSLQESGMTFSVMENRVDISVSDVQTISEDEEIATVEAEVQMTDLESSESMTYGMRHELEYRSGDWVIVSLDGEIIDLSA